jgi:hypothetical protein
VIVDSGLAAIAHRRRVNALTADGVIHLRTSVQATTAAFAKQRVHPICRKSMRVGTADTRVQITRSTPGRFRTRIVTEDVTPSLHVYYKATHIKQYHNSPVAEGRQRASGLRFADPRAHSLWHAMILFRQLVEGFRAAVLRRETASHCCAKHRRTELFAFVGAADSFGRVPPPSGTPPWPSRGYGHSARQIFVGVGRSAGFAARRKRRRIGHQGASAHVCSQPRFARSQSHAPTMREI